MARSRGTVLGHRPPSSCGGTRIVVGFATPSGYVVAVDCVVERDVTDSEAAAAAHVAQSEADERQRAAERREQAQRRAAEEAELRRLRLEQEHEQAERHARLQREAVVRKAMAEAEAEEARARARAAEADAKRLEAALKSDDLGPPIHRAVLEGDTRALQQLLRRLESLGAKKRKAVHRWRHESGETPLYTAAARNHTKGARPHRPSERHPLHTGVPHSSPAARGF